MGRVQVPTTSQAWDAVRRRSDREHRGFASSLRYRRTADAYDIQLNSGATVSVPRDRIAALRDLSQNEAARVSLSEFGDAMRLQSRDLAISVAGLLRDVTGLSEGQRRGGSATSAKKAAAVRENGKLGGRPRKKQIA